MCVCGAVRAAADQAFYVIVLAFLCLLQVRDLGLALSHSRAQVEQYRQQQAVQQRPGVELLDDLKRLKVRLVC